MCFAGSFFFTSQCFFFPSTISGQGEGKGKSLRSDREISLLIPDGFRHDGRVGEVEGEIGEGGRGRGEERVWIKPFGVLGEEMVWKMVGSLAPVAGGAWRDATAVENRLLPTTPAPLSLTSLLLYYAVLFLFLSYCSDDPIHG